MEPVVEPGLEPIPNKQPILMFGNIRGLISANNKYKVKLLEDIIKEKECFLVCLTESHLSNNIEKQ